MVFLIGPVKDIPVNITSMPSVDLPFGQTRVTIEDLHKSVDSDTARQELVAADVRNPNEAIDQFLCAVPSLLLWLEEHGRDYPWRWTTDPWQIYATEILLQRTRSDAVNDIYADFFRTFPKPSSILDADEETLRDMVRPLGFINHRTRTLLEAAELCVDEYDGNIPSDLEALRQPWRVGPYTARACLLFAFEKPLALVDTNTARIVGRVFDYRLPEQPHKSDALYRLLDALVPAHPPLARAFNFALLDLGAQICTSEAPNCVDCPIVTSCRYADQNSG